jgi:hypothetical protein
MEDETETVSHSVSQESIGLEDDDLGDERPVRSTKRPLDKSTVVVRAKKARRDTEMNMIRSLIEVVAQPDKNEATDDKCSNDEDAIFGQYIVTELRKIVDPTVKLMLKNNLTNMVFKARMGSAAPPQTGAVSFYQQFIPDQYHTQQQSSWPQQSYSQQEFNQDMRFQQQSTSFQNSNSINQAQKPQSEVHHQNIPAQFGDYSFSQQIYDAGPPPNDTFLQPI